VFGRTEDSVESNLPSYFSSADLHKAIVRRRSTESVGSHVFAYLLHEKQDKLDHGRSWCSILASGSNSVEFLAIQYVFEASVWLELCFFRELLADDLLC
jgi:hypothetical protein